MKKILASMSVICLLAVVAMAQSYSVITLPTPGLIEPVGIGVVKIAQVNVAGSTVADGTVILSLVSYDLTATNTLLTATCSGGKVTYNETNAVYLVSGEKLLRTGTATNGTCTIIVAQ